MSERLYDLLPVALQAEDAERGGALAALLAVLSEQLDAVEEDVRDLYDDLFIETCEPWVVPYIGALVDNDVLYDASRGEGAETAAALFTDLAGRDLRPAIGARVRADVARTIHYRRRKGTLAVLEELARNVMGWPVHATEGFEHLGWTQHVEHLRIQASLPDLRSPERCERIGTAFEDVPRTVDVRKPADDQGWPNVRTIGLTAWRLRADPLVWVTARTSPTCAFGYTFSPLGQPAPLFSRGRRESADALLASELDVAQPIRRTFFAEELRAHAASDPPRVQATDLYGELTAVGSSGLPAAPDASFVVYRDGVGIGPAVDPDAPVSVFEPGIRCARLDPWPTSPPAGAVVLVDVVAGRLAFGDGFGGSPAEVTTSHHAGFPAALGGGGYSREAWLLPDDGEVERRVVASRPGVTAPDGTVSEHTTLTDALVAWAADGSNPCVVQIMDSGTYLTPSSLVVPALGRLAIEAADEERPHLQTPARGLRIDVDTVDAETGDEVAERDVEATVTLSGLLVEGHVQVVGALRRLRLWHTTLVPGRGLDEDGGPRTRRPSIAADAVATRLRLEIAFSVTGPITAPPTADGVWLLDSILDGAGTDRQPALGGPAFTATDRGPRLTAERSTVFGRVTVAGLDASECIVTGPVDSQRTQAGCVRFSYVVPGSTTPRRYHCQPELAAEAAVGAALELDPTLTAAAQDALRAGVTGWLQPSFTERRYGQPAYAQLRTSCPDEIAAGAEDGSEMGAYAHLKQAQREANLRLRLAEHLPYGLEPATFYAT